MDLTKKRRNVEMSAQNQSPSFPTNSRNKNLPRQSTPQSIPQSRQQNQPIKNKRMDVNAPKYNPSGKPGQLVVTTESSRAQLEYACQNPRTYINEYGTNSNQYLDPLIDVDDIHGSPILSIEEQRMLYHSSEIDADESASSSKNSPSAHASSSSSSSSSNKLKQSNGHKKTVRSANHLLSFTYPARERPSSHEYRRPVLQYTPFKRERFVQANFKFIVSKSGDYTENIIDPDSIVDWELVEFVILPSAEEIICSICLDSPICPRIAKCGHVFCWHCIIRLFSYHEDSALAPCPVCLIEKIKLVDLRPVLIQSVIAAKQGDKLKFNLIQRPKMANILYDRASGTDQTFFDASRPLPIYGTPNATFNRMFITHRLMELFSNESDALANAIKEAKSSQDDSLLFLEIAQQMLKEEMGEMANQSEPKSTALSSQGNQSLTSSQLMSLPSPITKPAPRIKLAEIVPQKLEPDDCFFFHQAEDGQQIFLHPLSLKWLLEEFKEEKMLPSTLTLKVLDLESHTVDQKAKRKYNHLSHLPTSCHYQFALVDVGPLLKQPIFRAGFAEEVKKRSDALKKAQEREARKAEEAASKRAAKQVVQRPIRLLNMPDLVPPDLDDPSFPEFSAVNTSAMPTHDNEPPVRSAKPAASAWGAGIILKHKDSEEAFPALPIHTTPKNNDSSLVPMEEYLAQPSWPNARATSSDASSSAHQNAPQVSQAKGKKKQNKKVMLVL